MAAVETVVPRTRSSTTPPRPDRVPSARRRRNGESRGRERTVGVALCSMREDKCVKMK